ncbi:MAG: HYExAFE family protein [Phycisphaerae bacterium]
MKLHNHYESAFQNLLQQRALPYVGVDEAHRAAFAQVQLKSFDFIVYLPHQRNLLVDIKGRKAQPGKQDWLFDPWVGREDIEALSTWQEIFGNSFAAAFVFVFWLSDFNRIELFEPFKFREQYYRFYAIYLDDYRQYIKPRSSRWDTITIPRGVFQELAWNLDQFFTDLSPKK